ncbi:MAG: hypothetical protein KF883_10665 [Thermomicrobiales bacterium]|nr:hypothetical protein [Thermomicrobiales bacterium]
MALAAVQLDESKLDTQVNTVLVAAHKRAIETCPADIARFFQHTLGQKWTAFMTGVNDPKAVGKWARGERTPRDESLRKLRDAYQIAQIITIVDDEETVPAWFLGMNPYLDHRAPVWIIAREPDGSEQAMDAALAFISYG